MHEAVTAGYERWNGTDFDGFLSLFADDAVFVIPGSTSRSGEHDKAAFRGVLESVGAAIRDGQHRQELVCTNDGPSGSMCVFDNFVVMNGGETTYHSVHEWILRGGIPHVSMPYVHDYDLVESFCGSG